MQDVRGRNEGSLFRRKSGQWVALVTMRDGRRVSRWAKDRPGAQAELAELLRLRDAGAPFTGRVRLGEYLERWVSDEHGWAPATARKHESAVRVHLAGGPLGHLRLSEMSVGDVDRWLVGLVGLSAQSRRHLRSTLRRALADAHRSGLVTRNVGALSRSPGLHRAERAILDAAQARILIESTRGTRYGPLWTILVTTGLRISEALGLTWSRVDLATPAIRVTHQLARESGEWVRRQPKTAKGRRTIPLTPLGVEALRAQRDQQAQDRGATSLDGLVFTSPTGRPLHETNTLKALYEALAAADLPRVTQHDLRHSCATLLYSMGVPLETIADILGHSSSRITADLYRHRVQELQSAAAAKMQEALG